MTVENNTVIEERHKLLEKSNDLQKELAIVNETLQKLDNEILNLKTENQIFKTENCELKTAVEGFTERTASLSKDLIEAKEQTKEATLAKKNILEQYYEELEFRKDLEIKNSQLKVGVILNCRKMKSSPTKSKRV